MSSDWPVNRQSHSSSPDADQSSGRFVANSDIDYTRFG
jgi:hypothetical protein